MWYSQSVTYSCGCCLVWTVKSVHCSHSLCCSSCTFVSLMGFSTLAPLLVISTVTPFPVQAHLSTNQHSDSTHPHKPLLYDCNTSLHTCEIERNPTKQLDYTTCLHPRRSTTSSCLQSHLQHLSGDASWASLLQSFNHYSCAESILTSMITIWCSRTEADGSVASVPPRRRFAANSLLFKTLHASRTQGSQQTWFLSLLHWS